MKRQIAAKYLLALVITGSISGNVYGSSTFQEKDGKCVTTFAEQDNYEWALSKKDAETQLTSIHETLVGLIKSLGPAMSVEDQKNIKENIDFSMSQYLSLSDCLGKLK